MAKALNVELSEELLTDMAIAADFDSMRSKADQFAPASGSGMWKTETNFFANGSNAQWKEVLSEDDVAEFDKRLGELLSADEAHWLINGDG